MEMDVLFQTGWSHGLLSRCHRQRCSLGSWRCLDQAKQCRCSDMALEQDVAQYGRDDVSEPEHFYLKEQSNGAENRFP